MNQLRSIVVAVDFSLCSLKALAHAVRIARWNEARLHAVHVIDALVVSDLAEAFGIPRGEVSAQATHSAADELSRQVLEAGGEATISIAIGSPIDEILRAVRDVSADLLLVGATGSSATHPGAGTLAIQCVRKAPTKVLLIGYEAGPSFRTIVTGVDFSLTSLRAVDQARRVAAHEGTEIHCLHVYDPPWNRLNHPVPAAASQPDFHRQYLAALQRRLEKFVDLQPATQVRCALFPHPRSGVGMAEYARHVGADLIVLGARGRTNLHWVRAGTTAERLLREFACSVLVVRALDPAAALPTPTPSQPLS